MNIFYFEFFYANINLYTTNVRDIKRFYFDLGALCVAKLALQTKSDLAYLPPAVILTKKMRRLSDDLL